MLTRRAARFAVAGAAMTGVVLGFPGAAHASHTHAKVVGNGQCVILAAGAGEASVVLPDSVFTNNPNVDAPSGNDTRSHPLHVLVHLGVPGSPDHLQLYVLGTADANAACAAGYVND